LEKKKDDIQMERIQLQKRKRISRGSGIKEGNREQYDQIVFIITGLH
jgi:hypothetical protein